MNNIENEYRLTIEERKRLIAEIMPILEQKSKEEIDLVLHLLTRKEMNLLLKFPIKRSLMTRKN